MLETDLKTRAFVLRRTNYGETDRILNLLTPEGKISCLAKGVRKEKSKLAGGIELFTLSNVVVHRSQKSDLGLLTSAKMEIFYDQILKDLSSLELASNILKEINRISEHVDSPEFFDILKQSLEGLNNNLSPKLVETWFNFNLARARGEQINLLTDTDGEKLQEDLRYAWDSTDMALKKLENGNVGKNEIKIMRLMLISSLDFVSRIKGLSNSLDIIEYISRSVL
ncbi:DNA repair protein RecO [Candidatus Saccharibacteria bacterium]|nr:DNA repair protein RecO [Candidatus Saccharibacteria bacterium]